MKKEKRLLEVSSCLQCGEYCRGRCPEVAREISKGEYYSEIYHNCPLPKVENKEGDE